MRHIEDNIQESIINASRLYYPKSLLFAVPNGGKRNPREAVRLKKQGVTPGISDLILIHKGSVYFIEVKTEHGKQSLLQSQFQKFVEKEGLKYFIVTSAAEFLELIERL